ncbi:hypothetical protein [Amycolatopsis arida]
MATWKQFETEAPDLAAAVRARFTARPSRTCSPPCAATARRG